MAKRIIKLKESDLVKLVKNVISEQKAENTELAKLISFKCLKQGLIQITIGRCGTPDKGCYTFVYPPKKSDWTLWSPNKELTSFQKQVDNKKITPTGTENTAGTETWTISCDLLKKNIVYSDQGFNVLCNELAQYLLYKANCCGGGNNPTPNPQPECNNIRCKVESEIDKCTKKNFNWKKVKEAFEIEFPPKEGTPKSGSAERNRELWNEWKKGWRPKCGQTPSPNPQPKPEPDEHSF